MNFYKTLGLKNSRIDVADALRGLAVAGIILYHSVEHFNMYDGNIAHVYTLGCDDWMADVLALLLSGKMYGIFALLFGLSFFIMNDNLSSSVEIAFRVDSPGECSSWQCSVS